MAEQEIDFEFNFSDVTILEADGVFEDVCRLMEDGGDFYGQKVTAPKEWMIETTLTIDSMLGLGIFVLHFYNDKRVVVDRYESSGGDVFYNPDLPALSGWVQQKGWNPPEPSLSLVKSNIEFWKYHWQNLIVDSKYLDEVFGERPNLHPELHQKESETSE